MEDIKINDSEDLVISSGDFVITSDDGLTNDRQNIYDIVGTYLGHWRGSPLIGVGLNNYLNGPGISLLRQTIQSQLYADNFRIFSIDIDEGNEDDYDININARHK